jgi:hypothetical protein
LTDEVIANMVIKGQTKEIDILSRNLEFCEEAKQVSTGDKDQVSTDIEFLVRDSPLYEPKTSRVDEIVYIRDILRELEKT